MLPFLQFVHNQTELLPILETVSLEVITKKKKRLMTKQTMQEGLAVLQFKVVENNC